MIKPRYRTILLFGMPGSGKGTQGAVLGQLPGLMHISCGDVFRKLPKHGELSKAITQYLAAGKLVPDELVVRIWQRHMQILELQEFLQPERSVLVLDGLPRTPSQAKLLEETLDVRQIFYLRVSDTDQAKARLRHRALRESRLDDMSDEVIQRRLEEFQTETLDTLSFYDPSLVYDVDATKTPLAVQAEIVNRLLALEREYIAAGRRVLSR